MRGMPTTKATHADQPPRLDSLPLKTRWQPHDRCHAPHPSPRQSELDFFHFLKKIALNINLFKMTALADVTRPEMVLYVNSATAIPPPDTK
jgi:hypothetical protein